MGCPESVCHQGNSRQENEGPLQEKAVVFPVS